MGAGCPLSPTAKVRHDAYGATLDFLEALCDTSFALVSIPLQVRGSGLPRAAHTATEWGLCSSFAAPEAL